MRATQKLAGIFVCCALLAAAGCASGRSKKPAPPAAEEPAAPSEAAAEATPAAPAGEAPAAPAEGAAAAEAAPAPAEAKPAEGEPAPAPTGEPKPEEPKPEPKPEEPKPEPKPEEPKPEPKPEEPKPEEPKPEEPKPEPKPEEPKPEETKPAEAPPATAPAAAETVTVPAGEPGRVTPSSSTGPAASGGMGSSLNDFMRRQGQYFQDARVLGMRMRPYLTEEIGFTDNVYYQAEDEVLVVDDNPDGSPIRAFEVDGFDNDADGLVDEPGESLAEPRGEVSEVFSNLVVGMGFELPVNTALVPLVGEGSSSVKVFRAEVNWIEYFKETDSPDAVNFNVHFDLPQLLKISKDVNRNTFYVRVEGDYANITDPLDVAEYQFDSVNPTLTTGGDRADFTRTEWFAQGTFGWKGPRFDAKVLARHYDFSVDDDLLNSADHVEEHLYAEVGHSLQGTEHRVYALGEYVIYDFDQRGPTDDASQLRNFNLMRGGLGWEGPFLSRKVRGKAEAYYVNQTNVDGDEPPFPFDQNGNPTDYPEYSGMGGLARLVYRPYVTKSTEFQVEIDRHVDWSVVAQYKIVTEGTFSMSHPISERLIADLRYTISNEDVVRREQRLYQEAGLKFRYRLMAYTELFVQYTYRTMDQKDTLQETFTDGIGEPFVIEPDGDFTANIASVGISINF